MESDRLTPSESRIYLLIVEKGASDEELAMWLKRTPGGIKSDVDRIRNKLGIHSRAKMIVDYWAKRYRT